MKLSVKLSIVVAMVAMFFSLVSCTGKTNKSSEVASATVKSDNVEVYYFHLNRRCITCQTVESVAKQYVEETYGDNVPFYAYNIEEEEGKAKAKELGISGQTLAVIGAGSTINLTSQGFMNARNNPAKFEEIIKENVDNLLAQTK